MQSLIETFDKTIDNKLEITTDFANEDFGEIPHNITESVDAPATQSLSDAPQNKGTDTDALIDGLSNIDDAFDKEYKEISDIFDAEQNSNSTKNPSFSTDPWDKRKAEFDKYMSEQQEILEQKHVKIIKGHEESLASMINKELLRLNKLFDAATASSIDNITSTSQTQQDIINLMSSNTVQTCTDLCTNIEANIELKGTSIINEVAQKATAAEQRSIAKNNDDWLVLSNKMKRSQSLLATSNETAIRNNKILCAKLVAADKHIKQLDESIALQAATIENLSISLDKSEARLNSFRDSNSPIFDTIIDNQVETLIAAAVSKHMKNTNGVTDHVKDLIATAITSHMKDNSVVDDHMKHIATNAVTSLLQQTGAIKETEFLKSCNQIGENFTARLKSSVSTACTSFQNRADEITAKAIGNLNPKSAPQPAVHDGPPNPTTGAPRNSLFPNVDPSSIGCHNANTKDQRRDYNRTDFNNVEEVHTPLKDQEYIYDGQRHSVNTNTFYKLRWSNKCTSEVEIMSFYKALQHMASTCGIPMRDLDDIDEDNGVCPLTPENCINYSKVYKLMKGALYYKLNDATLWTGFDQGWNLVKSNLLDCDGFEVLYDVLSEVLPKLNKNTPKSHKIQRPTYTDSENDNIYSYVTAYSAFLEFEALGSNSRTYTPYEIAVYVADDLERDPHKRFEKGITYVRSQLKLSTDGITVPKDISLAKIAKTICKYSPEYTVGEHRTDPVIHAFRQPLPATTHAPHRFPKKKSTKDTSLKCPLCGQVGHDENAENGCFCFAKWTLCQQASKRLSETQIKENTRKFLRRMKLQQSTAKQREKIDSRIRSLTSTNSATDQSAIIQSLELLRDDLLEDTQSDESDSDVE